MEIRRLRKSWGLCLAVFVTFVTAGTWIAVHAQSLVPASVEVSLKPGESTTFAKTVHTPVIPPRPDICFLADTTGSMGTAIANVKANATQIMSIVRSVQPDAQFCAAQYRDTFDTPQFKVDQAVTASTVAVQAAINTWVAGGGGDDPEGQLHALTLLSTQAGFRADSTRIVVWFGDNPGHDPSIGGETLASTIAALQNEEVRVIAVPVSTPLNLGLDATGQATAITTATGGVLMATTNPGAVAQAILTGLTNLPVDVSMASDCATVTGGIITTSFAPPVQTVISGDAAVFSETILVSPAAVQGQTYTCSDWALLNGIPMTDVAGNLIRETKTIHVLDVTGPTAQCVAGTNPAGKVPNGNNEDGFFQLLASDNVGVSSIVICDSASSFCSGPFNSGDMVKIIQAPGVTPSDNRPGPGDIVSVLRLKGDAVLVVTDTSGLVARTSCLVPPPPK